MTKAGAVTYRLTGKRHSGWRIDASYGTGRVPSFVAFALEKDMAERIVALLNAAERWPT